MQTTAEQNVSLPIGLNNTARFTGTRVMSAVRNATQGGGSRRAGEVVGGGGAWTEDKKSATRGVADPRTLYLCSTISCTS